MIGDSGAARRPQFFVASRRRATPCAKRTAIEGYSAHRNGGVDGSHCWCRRFLGSMYHGYLVQAPQTVFHRPLLIDDLPSSKRKTLNSTTRAIRVH